MAIEAKLFSRRGAEAQSYKGAEAQTRKVQNLLPFKKNTLENFIGLVDTSFASPQKKVRAKGM